VFAYTPGDQFVHYVGYMSVNGLQHFVYTNAHERGHQAIFMGDDQLADKQYAIYNFYNPSGADPLSLDGDHVSDVWEFNHHMSVNTLDTTNSYGYQPTDKADDELLADVQALYDVLSSISQWDKDWADGGVNYGARGSDDPIPPDFFLKFQPIAVDPSTGTYTYGIPYHVRGLSDLPYNTLVSLP